MAKYRKIPVEIEAIKWTGKNYDEVKEFADGNCYQYNGCLFLTTVDGTINTNAGDYIVKNSKGEYKPMSSDIFEKTYEKVEAV